MTSQVPRSDFATPFGAYALSGVRETLRRLGDRTPSGKPGRMIASALRRLAVRGHARGIDGPHDIEIAPGVRARLYPSSNRCEKRALAGVHHWDSAERAALTDALEKNRHDTFAFLDIGANVGLYSLFLSAAARERNRPCRIVAVEPDPENRARLEFNITASEASVEVEPVAISSKPGSGTLSKADRNRGGIALTAAPAPGGVTVPLETLWGLVQRLGLSHIDAMKVDIEGHDLEALSAFFQDAPGTHFPDLLLLETGRPAASPLLDLAAANGYRVERRSGINAILRRDAT